jgi:hypothetical protein
MLADMVRRVAAVGPSVASPHEAESLMQDLLWLLWALATGPHGLGVASPDARIRCCP